MPQHKLYLILLGCRPPGRHVEQHDFYFGIGTSLKDLLPGIKAFWPEAAHKIHIDAWREVTAVDGYEIKVTLKQDDYFAAAQSHKLFFINLGGYQPDKFEEQHYTLLSVKPDMALALKTAKQTLFFKHHGFAGAVSHIDDKFGIDVDDLYNVEDMLSLPMKKQYAIEIVPAKDIVSDEIHLGYLKLSVL